MSELALTFFRLGFLMLLWLAVLLTLGVLRRDLRAPREAKPVSVAPTNPVAAAPKKAKRSAASQLVVATGELAGTVVPLGTAAITIGRDPASTIVLSEDYVSGKHARLYPDRGEWVLEDLQSTNGSWINGVRITSPTIVAVGSKIRIGRTELSLRK